MTTTAWKAPWDYHFPSPHFHFLSSLFNIFVGNMWPMWMAWRVWFIDPFLYLQWKLLSHTHISVYPLAPWYVGVLSFRSFADGSSHLLCCLLIYTVEIHPFPHPPSQSPIFQKLSGISIHVEKASWLMFYHLDPSCLPSFPPSLYFFSSSLLGLPSLVLLLLFFFLFILYQWRIGRFLGVERNKARWLFIFEGKPVYSKKKKNFTIKCIISILLILLYKDSHNGLTYLESLYQAESVVLLWYCKK